MKPSYIITVPHSGTTSLKSMFEDRNMPFKWTHCEKIYELSIPRLLVEFRVITTFREPELVAASWASRQPGGLTSFRNQRRWVANWTRWKMFVEGGANVYTMDELDCHLNKDHRPKRYKSIPAELLEYAEECARVLRP